MPDPIPPEPNDAAWGGEAADAIERFAAAGLESDVRAAEQMIAEVNAEHAAAWKRPGGFRP